MGDGIFSLEESFHDFFLISHKKHATVEECYLENNDWNLGFRRDIMDRNLKAGSG